MQRAFRLDCLAAGCGDKTGSGGYGTTNIIAVIWPRSCAADSGHLLHSLNLRQKAVAMYWRRRLKSSPTVCNSETEWETHSVFVIALDGKSAVAHLRLRIPGKAPWFWFSFRWSPVRIVIGSHGLIATVFYFQKKLCHRYPATARHARFLRPSPAPYRFPPMSPDG